MPTLITNGRIFTASDTVDADVLIDDGRIVAIGRNLDVGMDAEVIDAAGRYLLPGGVDVHTHLDSDFGNAHAVDTFATGGKAAAFGGTTTVVDFCSQGKGQSLLSALEDWHQRAACSPIDVGAHMVMSDVNEQTLAEMDILMAREGVTSFKMFTAYPGTLMVDDGTLIKAMKVAANGGGQVSVHCENGYIIQHLVEEAVAAGNLAPKYHMLTRPPVAESEAVNRVICLAELVGVPLYIVHLSTLEGLKVISEARRRGVHVHAETCPHYLFLSTDLYDKPGFEGAKAILSPPLRTPEHAKALWSGLQCGDVDVIATDHCAFTYSDVHGKHLSKLVGKEEGFHKVPNGGPGIEERMKVMFGGMRDHDMSVNRFVQVTATDPAKLFGLYPQKGTIAVGSDADIVIMDPDGKGVIRAADGHGRIDYTLFEGHDVSCAIDKVFLRGKVIVDGDAWHGEDGHGAYIARGASGWA